MRLSDIKVNRPGFRKMSEFNILRLKEYAITVLDISDKRQITGTFDNLQTAGIAGQTTSPGEAFTSAPAHAAAQSIQPAFGLLPGAALE